MFSSEQKFEVSGDISQLEATIKFAIEMEGIGKSSICSDSWEGIKNPFYGIVSIEPFVNFYSK